MTPQQHRKLQSKDVREFLEIRLPDFMVPSTLVVLDKIPLKTSGKIDHEALIALEGQQHEERPYVPPQTTLEAELAELWQEILEAPRVGRDDNFFELGGHSLLATQVVSRVREQYRVPLPLRELMEAPNLAGFAEAVQTAMWATQAQQSSVQDLDKEEFIV